MTQLSPYLFCKAVDFLVTSNSIIVEYTFLGQKDEDGEPHGRGTLSFNADGKDIFQGHFVHGKIT